MDPTIEPGASSTPQQSDSLPNAPAPAAAPTLSASEAAVQSKDFSTFRAAKDAERSGKPAPASPAASPTATSDDQADAAAAGAAAGDQQPPKPRRGADARKEQLAAEINDLLKQRATLKQEVGGAPPVAAPAATEGARAGAVPPKADPKPNPTDLSRYPDGQYDPQFIEDLGRWSAREERRQFEADERARTVETERTERSRTRNETFTQRFDAAMKADASFLEALSPDVLQLRPFDALQPGEAPTALNALAEEIMGSEVAPALLRHFSEHPADLSAFAAYGPRELLRAFARLEDRYLSAKPAGDGPGAPDVRVLSQAPPPATALSGKATTPGDPVRAAVGRQDFTAYREAKRARAAAGLAD